MRVAAAGVANGKEQSTPGAATVNMEGITLELKFHKLTKIQFHKIFEYFFRSSKIDI